MIAPEIDWPNVRRVLVVKLRSIGDTVLSTPSLIALRRFLPDAQIDIMLEDWVAPVLDGFDEVDNVIWVPTKRTQFLPEPQTSNLLSPWAARFLGRDPDRVISTQARNAPDRKPSRIELVFVRGAIARRLRETKYDVALNLHGGTTATFFTRASSARHRIGYSYYQYPFLYNHLLLSASEFWKQEKTHSAEQQLALLGFVGVPVNDRPKSRLAVTQQSIERIDARLSETEIALLHPSTAFFTKQWATENFVRTAEFLAEKGLHTVAVGSKNESKVLEDLKRLSNVPVTTFDDLPLPEITALASKANIFVGNDSGIAHIAAAVGTPSVVIFGSSNRDHWRPWTGAPNEIVFEPLPCQPCPGYECQEFGDPKCILGVRPSAVFAAIERVLS